MHTLRKVVGGKFEVGYWQPEKAGVEWYPLYRVASIDTACRIVSMLNGGSAAIPLVQTGEIVAEIYQPPEAVPQGSASKAGHLLTASDWPGGHGD